MRHLWQAARSGVAPVLLQALRGYRSQSLAEGRLCDSRWRTAAWRGRRKRRRRLILEQVDPVAPARHENGDGERREERRQRDGRTVFFLFEFPHGGEGGD